MGRISPSFERLFISVPAHPRAQAELAEGRLRSGNSHTQSNIWIEVLLSGLPAFLFQDLLNGLGQKSRITERCRPFVSLLLDNMFLGGLLFNVLKLPFYIFDPIF